MNIMQMVEDFNRVVIGVRPTNTLLAADLQFILIALKEEIEELRLANDQVNQVDAIIDIIYFAAGYFSKSGISAEVANKIFATVHESNMSKVRGAKPGREMIHEHDAIKPEGWLAPEKAIANLLK